MITHRELYLMRAAVSALEDYDSIESWLKDTVNDCGNTVNQLIDFEADEYAREQVFKTLSGRGADNE